MNRAREFLAEVITEVIVGHPTSEYGKFNRSDPIHVLSRNIMHMLGFRNFSGGNILYAFEFLRWSSSPPSKELKGDSGLIFNFWARLLFETDRSR